MDTITHGLVGRLVARSVWPDHDRRGLVNLATITSVLPDVDTFFAQGGLEKLQVHRGVTHSLVGAAVAALLVTWVARWTGLREVRFKRVYLASLCGFSLHILFDLVTSYGTMLFVPFSEYRAHLDVLFIVDPYLDMILVGGLLLGYRTRLQGGWGYRAGLAVLAAYMLLNLGLTGMGYPRVQDWARGHGIEAEWTGVLPVPLSPLHRRGFAVSQDRIYEVPIRLSSAGDSVSFPLATADPRLEALWGMKEGRIYRWFARFPVVRELSGDQEGTLLVQDLQFLVRPDRLGWLGTWAAGLLRDHNPSFFDRRVFALRVRLNENNRVGEVTYLGP